MGIQMRVNIFHEARAECPVEYVVYVQNRIQSISYSF